MTILRGRFAGTFLCPRCGQLAIRWADLANTACGSCQTRRYGHSSGGTNGSIGAA